MLTALSGFRGRSVLVTGSGRNIGRAVALAFAGAGADVAVNVRGNEAEGRKVVAEIEALGRRAVLLVGDIADPTTAAGLVASTERELGSIDYLVNCAAYRSTSSIADLSVEEWNLTLASDVSALFYLSKAAAPLMAGRGFGRLITLGGMDSGNAGGGHSHVFAAKAAAASYIKSFAWEYGRSGITANVVAPGTARTVRAAREQPKPRIDEDFFTRFPIPRLGEPEELANACLFLASDEASYVTGQVLRVNGGREM